MSSLASPNIESGFTLHISTVLNSRQKSSIPILENISVMKSRFQLDGLLKDGLTVLGRVRNVLDNSWHLIDSGLAVLHSRKR